MQRQGSRAICSITDQHYIGKAQTIGSYLWGWKTFRARLLGASKTEYATRKTIRAMVNWYAVMSLVSIIESPVDSFKILALPAALLSSVSQSAHVRLTNVGPVEIAKKIDHSRCR